jgi:hypothetical protein
MFNLHGAFKIELRNDIVFVDMIGAWNIETAIAFSDEIKKVVKPIYGRPWAALTHMDEWELCTPECKPVIVEFSLNAKRSGLTREAVVNEKESTKLELFSRVRNDSLVKQANPEFDRRFFKNIDPGLAWLHSEGFGKPAQI